MSVVQRTMHPDRSYGPGRRTEAPWACERLPKRLRLSGYLLAVVAADLALTGWLLARAQPQLGQLLPFAAFLGCGAACVEATRRWGAPPTGTRDLLTAWWLPTALLLPPVYAATAPVLVGSLAHWRARQGPLYWRGFSAAALGLAGAATSLLFHQVGAVGHGLQNPVTVAEAAGCAGLFVLANAALVAIAGRAAHPGRPWLSAAWDSESLLVDLAGLCAGMLVTIACALNWVLLLVALPPIILLQRSLLHQQLRAAARTDGKTGLLNAVAWQREAETWIRRALRAGAPAAILLVDIDHFKRVNDTYGHLAGDELLAVMAATLQQNVRTCDVLGRFGGEEFVAVLPGAGEQEACRIAERLRERVRALSVPARAGRMTVTISIGVAALGQGGSELFELLAAADAALYRAKRSGRDRVCTLPPGAGPSDPRPGWP
jgi:diguanylate cyclase (GGDEF)-like protein